MVIVPTWQPEVRNLPGASNIPHATGESFGSQVGAATQQAGEKIGHAMASFGEALGKQQNEQDAIAAKVALSDHETAVKTEQMRLDATTSAADRAKIPDLVTQFAIQDWQPRSGNINGRYKGIADSNAHNFWNQLQLQNQAKQIKGYYDALEQQIGNEVDKQSAILFKDPSNLTSAANAIRAYVDEATIPPEVKRSFLSTASTKLVAQITAGYELRIKEAEARTDYATATILRAEAEKRVGALPDELNKALGIHLLPKPVPPQILQPGQPLPLGNINKKRISMIDNSEAGPIITQASLDAGVDPNVAKVIASIESSGNPRSTTGSYSGLFQLSKSEFEKYGGGDILDPTDNANAGAKKLAAESAEFAAKVGRPPTPVELYLIHQQGWGGAFNHLSKPNELAWQNMYDTAEGRQKGERWAKKAIWGNIPNDMKRMFPGGVDDVTSADFISIWSKKITG